MSAVQIVRDWLHEARSGVVRLPRNAMLFTHAAYRRQGRNAFEIGRDYQRGFDREITQPLTTAIQRKGA